MPYIKIESGKLTDEQKTLLIKRVTEVSAEIMNIPQEFFTPLRNCPIKTSVSAAKPSILSKTSTKNERLVYD